MKKTASTRSRLEAELSKSKYLMKDSRAFSSPRLLQRSLPRAFNDSDLDRRKKRDHSDIFVPYESERDRLGRLKQDVSLQEQSTRYQSERRNASPKAAGQNQQLQEVAVPRELVDLRPGQPFKIAEGFQRQANILARNKEFMKFLNEQRSTAF
jgi:hypothetical protein